MRVADYVFEYLAEIGVRHVFLVVGGGAMYLNDALKKSKRIQYICCHHEQACAMAAEGYSRSSSRMGVFCVTSGPGGTNAVTGVLGSWLDSIPILGLSGQVKQETTIQSTQIPGLRQLGDQEADIISIVRPITKYARTIIYPDQIRFELHKAAEAATTGRPGPAWIDIPLDVQKSLC